MVPKAIIKEERPQVLSVYGTVPLLGRLIMVAMGSIAIGAMAAGRADLIRRGRKLESLLVTAPELAFFLPALLIIFALIIRSSHTVFDLEQRQVRYSGGRPGPRRYITMPIRNELMITLHATDQKVTLRWQDGSEKGIFLFWHASLGSHNNRNAPVTNRRSVRANAQQIVDWLNQHGARARLNVSASRPVRKVD